MVYCVYPVCQTLHIILYTFKCILDHDCRATQLYTVTEELNMSKTYSHLITLWITDADRTESHHSLVYIGCIVIVIYSIFSCFACCLNEYASTTMVVMSPCYQNWTWSFWIAWSNDLDCRSWLWLLKQSINYVALHKINMMYHIYIFLLCENTAC